MHQFGIARDYNGVCNLRMDDTNPKKKRWSMSCLINDVHWLGFDWGKNLFYASTISRSFMNTPSNL